MIHIAVVGHISRLREAEALAQDLGGEMFIDNLSLGATWNHLRALNWGSTRRGHLIVLEDDAQPVGDFTSRSQQAISDHPDDLISFYLGTGYPPQYQATIASLLSTAPDFINTLPTLIHAVAYALPCNRIPRLALNTRSPADYGLGRAWMEATARRPIYTVPSLVEHADTDSIQNKGKRAAPRKAWKLP